MVRELTGWSRPKGCIICGTGIFLLALTTALGYSVIHFQPFAEGTAWLDLWDFIVSNNVLPLGSLVREANTGRGLKIRPWMRPVFQYITPVIIAFIYAYGMATFQWR